MTFFSNTISRPDCSGEGRSFYVNHVNIIPNNNRPVGPTWIVSNPPRHDDHSQVINEGPGTDWWYEVRWVDAET